jgi:two-component system alkaline phosphatase synthesis response regulator PhoP
MYNILVVAGDGALRAELEQLLSPLNYRVMTCAVEKVDASISAENPDIILFALGEPLEAHALRRLLRERAVLEDVAVLAVVPEDQVRRFDVTLGLDDFMAWPAALDEAETRIRQALWRRSKIDSENILKQGDLVIDLGRYQVSVAGHPVELTFKEYELLRFLASNPGKVFTREALLNRVWGYDYFGGARTVDVHIRRLRSKIEDRHHTFIETIRNVGYRFAAG